MNNSNQKFIREKDYDTLKFLKLIPNLLGIFGSLSIAGCLRLHYNEVDKYYGKKLLEKEEFLKNNPQSKNFFPSKNIVG